MINKIADFIEGNVKYYMNKLFIMPKYLQEQIIYRLFKCKEDCVQTGICKKCGTCPTKKKVLLDSSCNKDRFPDLMTNDDWEIYKTKHNINIKKIMEDEL